MLYLHNFSAKRLLIPGLLMIGVASYLLWRTDHSVTHENGLLEGSQSIFLLLAVICQGIFAIRSSSKTNRDIRFGLALFCLALLLREFDVNAVGTSPGWEILENTLRGITAALFILYLIHLRKQFYYYWQNLSVPLTSTPVLLSIAGCIIYAIGWPFDKHLFDISEDISVFIEETLELEATFLFLLAAFTPPVNDIFHSHGKSTTSARYESETPG